MKRNLSIIVLVSLCISSIYAAPILPNEALQKAKSFLLQQTENSSVQHAPIIEPTYTLAYSCTEVANTATPNGVLSSETPFFYVFNRENGGFVIVSGDDRAREILGYSNSGSFDVNNIPDNMRWFLSIYASEIAMLGDSDIVWATTPQHAPTNQTETTSVESFIQTDWNQDAPYNNLCPNHYYTGCVATAMAQIMKYYEFPITGTGSHSYFLPGTITEYSANFGATTYDWANMRNTYNDYNAAEANAVATLMYHCGVSVDMNYGPEASGAQSSNVVFALKTYFGYDPGVQLLHRNNYTDTQWDNIIKAELDAAPPRPVYYAGDNGTSGHAFVCDGYAANSSTTYFHINWGWGGMSNGLFASTALNPGSWGPGGGSGFNYNQEIITGIKPINGQDANLACNTLQIDGMLVRNAISNFSFSITNNGEQDYNSLISLDITTSDYTQYQPIYQQNEEFIGSGQTKTFDNLSATITLPAGSYFFVINYKKSGVWKKLYYVPVTVVINENISVDLTCNSLQADGTLTTGTVGNFIANITNNSAVDYNSRLVVELLDWEHKQTVSQNIESISAGETKIINFSSNITLSAGTYFLVVKYDKNNNSGSSELDILRYAQVEIQNSTGVTDHTFSEITLYPNPAVDELFIQTDETVKRITIFDVSGKIMSIKEYSPMATVSVDVSSFANGLYLLKTETEKGTKTLKFYKK